MKDGPLPDMDQAVGTVIFAEPYCGVKEMPKIRGYLVGMLKKQKRDVEVMKKIKKEDPEFCNQLVRLLTQSGRPQTKNSEARRRPHLQAT